jgi:hypothetical protein
MPGKLRRRFDRMEGQASRMMSEIVDLVDEVQDDIRIRFVKDGEGTIMDFLLGKQDECPVCLKVQIEE